MSDEWFTDRLKELDAWVSEQGDDLEWNSAITRAEDCGGRPNTTDALTGGFHCRIRCRGNDAAICLTAAQKALEILCHGQRTIIRQVPSSETYTDFMAETVSGYGSVRFYVLPSEGEWTWPKEDDGIRVRFL